MQFVGAFYGLLRARGDEAQAAATATLLNATARISAEYARSEGPFFAGARLSLADVLIWPWIARLGTLQHYRKFAVPDEPQYAAYHAFVAVMRARPAVQATQSDDAYFIEGYKSYAVDA